jgi:hypothetical protein
MTALKRIKENTIELRLLNKRNLPNFNVNFYIIDKLGRYAGVAMYTESSNEDKNYAICTENGSKLVPVEPLLSGNAN